MRKQLTEDEQFTADVRQVTALIETLEAARPALARLGVLAMTATYEQGFWARAMRRRAGRRH